ncbi:hypothetical protein RvY_07377-1 [Ramazzottius varieornatus]|uniref:Proteasome subunit beta n=1 Tax=Ramazzottius varieornatus TaxID=947166 RepID=A0A1D1V4I5_RAMVA|nr:hypothetical protein RvY_07377-1 [Ramazzottius varieornatus]
MEPKTGYDYTGKEEDFVNTPISTGTTIVAVEYGEGLETGIVIGADSRTTSGTYVSNRFTDKLTRVTENIYCCRSGSAADTQAIADIVAYHLSLLEVQTGEPPRVRVAAKLFQELCYNNRDSLMAGIICAGWDRYEGGQVNLGFHLWTGLTADCFQIVLVLHDSCRRYVRPSARVHRWFRKHVRFRLCRSELQEGNE